MLVFLKKCVKIILSEVETNMAKPHLSETDGDSNSDGAIFAHFVFSKIQNLTC